MVELMFYSITSEEGMSFEKKIKIGVAAETQIHFCF